MNYKLHTEKILSQQIIDFLLYKKELKKQNNKNRSCSIFRGFVTIGNNIQKNGCITKSGFQNVTTRHVGRIDFQLTNAFVQWTGIANEINKSNIINIIKNEIKCDKLVFRTINVMIVLPNAEDQPIHTDIAGKKRGQFFVTVIIPLNPITNKMGGTEIFCDCAQKSIIVKGEPGFGFYFCGNVKHRGLANKSQTTRFFLYFALSKHNDPNSDSVVYTI